MDGSESLLYLECLFPYFFVEQKHGWSGVQARIPTYLGIQDVSKRSAEFILSLQVMDAVLERQRLESANAILESDWKALERQIAELGRRSGVLVQGVPKKPTTDWRRADRVEVQVASGGGWISLSQEIDQMASRLEGQLRRRAVHSVGEAAPQIEAALAENQDNGMRLAVVLSEAVDDLEQAKRRETSVGLRVEALEEDLRKHKDASLLRNLGSGSDFESLYENCPTCGQLLPDGFEITDYPLTIEDNISLLERELSTFRSMSADARRAVERGQVRVSRLRDEMASIRSSIRAQKDALVSPNSLPDAAALSERIQLQGRIDALRAVRDEIEAALDELDRVFSTWRQTKEQLSRLRNHELNPTDAAKVAALRTSLVSQLHSYGFRSMDPSAVDISDKTYRPIHEGFDLGFDLSASDMVRVIWSYLFAFMEVSRERGGNHPQLLVFDEPRQQEASRISFQQLLRRAAQNGSAGSQILFATSEEEHGLREMLRGLPHSMTSVPRGKLIKPMTG